MSKRICVFGSSIAHGHNDDKSGGWCNQLKIYCLANDSSFSVYNLSVSGAMSKDVVERFEFECGARHPEIALIAIGMNDSTFDKNINNNRIILSETKKNLETLIKMSQSMDIQLVFIGLTSVAEELMSPVPWASNLSYNNTDIKKYDKIIETIANEHKTHYCYMYDLLQAEDLDDGLHPNAEGHKKMFERIKRFLIENKLL